MKRRRRKKKKMMMMVVLTTTRRWTPMRAVAMTRRRTRKADLAH
jgi:hypothetical protein